MIESIALFKPHSVVVYQSFEGGRTQENAASLENLEKGAKGDYNGYMSPATRRQVKKYLDNWLLSMTITTTGKITRNSIYPTFITLTLPAAQAHDDNDIKRNMLGYFITQLKRYHHVKNYFWRAEPQQNDNIHFHLVVDAYIHHAQVKKAWNSILDQYGYLETYRQNLREHYRAGFQINGQEAKQYIKREAEKLTRAGKKPNEKVLYWASVTQQRQRYERGQRDNFNTTQPNSTDIHKLKKLRSITAYISKYLTKANDVDSQMKEKGRDFMDRKINGRIWGCSDDLKTLTYHAETVAIEDFDMSTTNDEVKNYLDKLAQVLKAEDVIKDENFTVYRLNVENRKLMQEHAPSLHHRYQTHYNNTFLQLYGSLQTSFT
ncbi:rolling circle replication-associated protein [Salmonirosea aquatica]|uniref:Replication-associated protein ORF2/G2P domain-containing protein n=1 Tax=Salmonirosea aquatica TaxID=2654236 RepID=A0A7C9BEI4_9BACT|nr:hypothetical protein [Cytophagaceae bacterium SJW1-29]MPR37142.1 hypothetical protein [Cytophagaceae bacterium SJW1-29]